MRTMRMKNNYKIENYKSLIRLKRKLQSHINKQEKKLMEDISFIDPLTTFLSNKKTKKGSGNNLNLVHSLSPVLNKFFGGFIDNLEKSERTKSILHLVSVLSSYGISIFANQKLNQLIGRFANRK